MHYDALENRHGLPHDPLKALLVPRPIGWISTISKSGLVNLAPYSFFNGVGEKPGYVVFGSAGIKDNLRNIEETGEFTCSLATYDLREQMNITSAPMPYGEDEFPLAGLTAAPSRYVKPPRVKESPAALECRHFQTIALPGAGRYKQNYHLVIGLIVGIYIDDRFIKDGIVDTAGMMPIARLGYMDYSVVRPDTVFTIERPTAEDARANHAKSV
jgi:flavin reductase (DIM6/NTAB) family NADH-FMN oxidoreductase RutF